jgi:hypothetical protein
MNHRRAAWEFLLSMLFRSEGETPPLAEQFAQSERFWEEALSIANTSLVTAPLWTVIEKRGIADFIHPDARDYLEGFHVVNGERNAAILGQLTECCELLADAGIAVMPFKGSSFLVDELYDDLSDRFLTDLDLIIPEEKARAAWDILRNAGYELARPDTGNAFSAPHQLEPLVKIGRPAELELHVAPVPVALQQHLPTDELWAYANRRNTVIGDLTVPSATDAILNSILHTELIDGHSSRLLLPLRAYRDIHLLWQKRRFDIDEARIEARLSTLPARDGLHLMIATLRAFSGEETLARIEPGLRGRLRSRLCRAAAVRPALANAAGRRYRLSDRGIRNQFGIAGTSTSLTSYRIQVIGGMLRQALKRLGGKGV